MDQSLDVANIKSEPTDLTSSDRQEIPTDMQMDIFQQESDCLVQSAIYIKTEPQQDECEFPIIAGTSYEKCLNYNMQIETEERFIKIKRENLENEVLQDSLDIDNKINDEEYFPIDLDQGESKIKTEPIEVEKDESLLETNEDDSYWRGTNQDRLIIRNDPDCTDKIYVCNECKKTFKKKWNLNIHLRIHSGITSFACEVCKKSFSQKSNLSTHMLIHSDEKPHACDVCEKVFRHKFTLDNHKLIHSGEKPFSCSQCNKSFAQKSLLVIHERVHTGDKPFSCDICYKAFVKKSDVTRHKRIHTGEKPYSCEICNRPFRDKSTLNKHKKIHKN